MFATIVAAEGGYQEFVLGGSEMTVLWLSVARRARRDRRRIQF